MIWCLQTLRIGRRAMTFDHAAQLLAKGGIREIVAADGIVIMEVGAGSCEAITADWNLLDRRRYGGTEILFLKVGSEGR